MNNRRSLVNAIAEHAHDSVSYNVLLDNMAYRDWKANRDWKARGAAVDKAYNDNRSQLING